MPQTVHLATVALLLLMAAVGATPLLLPAPPPGAHPPTPLTRSPRSAVVGGGRPGEDFPALNSVPRTAFSCAGRRPGYYADVATACQVFHVCHSALRKDSFLCPNGTIFHQLRLVCDWWYNVECSDSAGHEDVNVDFGRVDAGVRAGRGGSAGGSAGRSDTGGTTAGRSDTGGTSAGRSDTVSSIGGRSDTVSGTSGRGGIASGPGGRSDTGGSKAGGSDGRGSLSFGISTSSAQGSFGGGSQSASGQSDLNNFGNTGGQSLGTNRNLHVNEIQSQTPGPRVSFRGTSGVSNQNNNNRGTPRPPHSVPTPPTGPTLPDPDPTFENPSTPRSSFVPSFGPTAPSASNVGSNFNSFTASPQPTPGRFGIQQQQQQQQVPRPASARRQTGRPLQAAGPQPPRPAPQSSADLQGHNLIQGTTASPDPLPPATISPTTIARQHQRQNQRHRQQQQVFGPSVGGGHPLPTQAFAPHTTPKPFPSPVGSAFTPAAPARTASTAGRGGTVRGTAGTTTVTTAVATVTTVPPPAVTTLRPQVTQRKQTISHLLTSQRARGSARSEDTGGLLGTTPVHTGSRGRGPNHQQHQQTNQQHQQTNQQHQQTIQQHQQTIQQHQQTIQQHQQTIQQHQQTNQQHQQINQHQQPQQQRHRGRDRGPKVSTVTIRPPTVATTAKRPTTTRRQPTMTKVFRKPLGQATTTPVRPISSRGRPTPQRATTPSRGRPSHTDTSGPVSVKVETGKEDRDNEIVDVRDRFGPPSPPAPPAPPARRGGTPHQGGVGGTRPHQGGVGGTRPHQGGVAGTGLVIGTPVRVPNILSPLAAGRPLQRASPQPSSRPGLLLGTTDTTLSPQGKLPSLGLPRTPVGGAPAVQLGSSGPRILPTNLPHFNEILDFVRSVGGKPLLKKPPGGLAQRITPPPPIPFAPQGGHSLTHEQRDQQQQRQQLQQQRDILQQQQLQERQNLINLSRLQQQLEVQQQQFKKQQQKQILQQQQLIEQQQHKIEEQARHRQQQTVGGRDLTSAHSRGRGGARFKVTLDDDIDDPFFDGDDHFDDDIDDIDDYDEEDDDNDIFVRPTVGLGRQGAQNGALLGAQRGFTQRPTPRFNRQAPGAAPFGPSAPPAGGGAVPPPAETFLPPPPAA